MTDFEKYESIEKDRLLLRRKMNKVKVFEIKRKKVD